MTLFILFAARIFLLGYERIAGKQISENEDTFVASWAFFTFSLLMLLPLYWYITPNTIRSALISGSIYSLSFFLYTYALSHEDASVVAPLYNINIFFLLLITFLFLGEKITLAKTVGSIFMVYGISYLKKGATFVSSYKNIFKNKGSAAMIAASILLALGRTADGYFSRSINSLGYSVSIYIVVSLYLFLASMIKHRGLKKHFDIIKRKKYYLIGGGIANAYSYLALLMLFKYIDVNVAVPLSMLSSIVTAILAYFIFKEKIALRLVGIGFLIFGSFLIYAGQ